MRDGRWCSGLVLQLPHLVASSVFGPDDESGSHLWDALLDVQDHVPVTHVTEGRNVQTLMKLMESSCPHTSQETDPPVSTAGWVLHGAKIQPHPFLQLIHFSVNVEGPKCYLNLDFEKKLNYSCGK